MSMKQPRGKYTLEFKQEGVRQVRAGQSAAAVARSLGIPKASLSNWVRLDARGQLGNPQSEGKVPASVTPEQMEITRLRAENVRLKMERDIAKKAAACGDERGLGRPEPHGVPAAHGSRNINYSIKSSAPPKEGQK